jgi:hypothetical protein
MKTINKILGVTALTLTLASCGKEWNINAGFGKEYNINGTEVIDGTNTIHLTDDNMFNNNGSFTIYNRPIKCYLVKSGNMSIYYNLPEDSVVINEANKKANYFVHQMYLQEKQKKDKKELEKENARLQKLKSDSISRAKRLNFGLNSLK